ncbi:MAG: phytanoyl-CoA dioxygenase family protein [Proteobacteria bacterium]|nr:phytanoyl-CoA dioxygenase family protein [Pseudomonadota bacterium]MDA1331635.1 phytanoyl-CoA dioxygenase family protein [Pseudomonadota bacterium]
MNQAQLNCYRKDGFLSPIKVFSEEKAGLLRAQLEDYESMHGPVMKTPYRNKPHLIFPWVAEVIRDPKISDIVESILGPNLLVWGTNFFIKEPNDGTFVSWHQDSTYWGLSRPDVLTVWIALSPSRRANGAMKMVSGSHKLEQLAHTDTFEPGNLLTRGQKIDQQIADENVAWIELEPGEVSLHHVRIIHGSEANTSSDRRIGLAIRFIPTDLSQVNGVKDYATLVRGHDEYNHFEHEPCPKVSLGDSEIATHTRIVEESFKLFYQGTGREPKFGE